MPLRRPSVEATDLQVASDGHAYSTPSRLCSAVASLDCAFKAKQYTPVRLG